MKLAAIAVVLSTGCAEPVVEMQLKLPSNADMLDASCVTAVEVHAIGKNYPSDPMDFKRSCVEIGGAATYAQIRDAIHGKFALPMPDSGLAGIEMYGWSGAAACANPGVAQDLIFFSSTPYIGQSVIELQPTPNLNHCVQSQIKVRIVDLFTLISGPTPTSANCTASMIPDDATSGAAIGTLTPKMFDRGVNFYGLLSAASHASVVALNAYTDVGPKSCLAFSAGGPNSGSVACAMSGPTVCATAGELEHAVIDGGIGVQTTTLDPALLAKYPGIVYGSVWSNGATKHPIAGATVEVSSADGSVIYIDPPDAGSVSVKRRTDNMTGPTGLFLLFTNKLTNVKVNAAGAQRTVQLGALDESDGAAVIVMN
jgi:hypothetical protein